MIFVVKRNNREYKPFRYINVNWTYILFISDISSLYDITHNCSLEHSEFAFSIGRTDYFIIAHIEYAILAAENSKFKSGFIQLNDIDQIFLLITTV